MKSKDNYNTAFAFLATLFFMWGFITVLVDALVPRLKDVFELSYGQSIMVQLAFFGAFFCFAIPSSFLLERIGYQRGIVIGLCIMGIACILFYPAASMREFWIFITAFFTLAAGITLLQVAANPYVTLLGDEKTASSRLNLSQAFNSFGTLLAPIIGALFLLSDTVMDSKAIEKLNESDRLDYYASEALTVQEPFIIIALILFALAAIFGWKKLPSLIKAAPVGGYSQLLSNKKFLFGMLGIFMYVGAEVSIGSFLVNYFQELDVIENIKNNEFLRGLSSFLLVGKDIDKLDAKAVLGSFVTLYWGGAMIGRFIGAFLMRFISSGRLLMIFGLLAITMIVISVSSNGTTAMFTILAVGLFNSIMFPTIFSLALNGLDNLKAQASGLLVMAIVGGAIIPKLIGTIADAMSTDEDGNLTGQGLGIAFLCLTFCYGYIAYYGLTKRKV
ncbi:sugar MFS transporter [Nonlabens ulvanivorans]|uniref:FHS family L-fucose permease-like MFS transporter n=1 Tax=Nonlabens ulvanivorans TaxID=906888 RepID=A0A084JV94_NONUL|nr:sugar MFS transporter [Nonlabens ulvanivorans]KEZ92878.1 glucose/galactose transporter [Nonlabens ulvanivorans]PRX15734.1 FHS family L-fucose permease-like MFS transporter [Nonlabens ulvanivorans]